jgi:hypothetical protein
MHSAPVLPGPRLCPGFTIFDIAHQIEPSSFTSDALSPHFSSSFFVFDDQTKEALNLFPSQLESGECFDRWDRETSLVTGPKSRVTAQPPF